MICVVLGSNMTCNDFYWYIAAPSSADNNNGNAALSDYLELQSKLAIAIATTVSKLNKCKEHPVLNRDRNM